MQQLGLVEGRHPMPVRGYLLPKVTPPAMGYDMAQKAMVKRLEDYPDETDFHVYLTGLTCATMGMIAAFINANPKGRTLHIWEWHPDIRDYLETTMIADGQFLQ